MCGISLILHAKERAATTGMPDGEMHNPLAAALGNMQQQQLYRGPDSGGMQLLPWGGGGTLALGSRRLQILDASQEADQPMQRAWSGKKGWLSYNGELYNWSDLRNELLQLGCSFSTSSDTEVVLFALLQWGREVLQRFNGMFALAYYEEQADGTHALLLARDRWGQKPLYYAHQNQYWVVASELQAVLASGLIKKQLNQEQLLHYLRYKFASRPQTFFGDIWELEPGHFLLLQAGQEAVVEKFTPESPALMPSPADDAAVLNSLDNLLADSLLGQLQADRPVGLFLSGGVDSTLMLALLREHAPGQIPLCFTIGTEAADPAWGTADLSWAQKAAKQYGAYHQALPITAATVLNRFVELASRQDQPTADGAWLLSCLLSEAASAKVKVVLSGAGADEQFAGYHRHAAFSGYLKHKRWLTPFLPLLKKGSQLLPTGRGVPGRKQWQLLQKFGAGVGTDPYQTFLNFTQLSILAQEAEVTQDRRHNQDPLQWALEHDRSHYLVSDVLALNDKAGMQWSLEMRMPYLDGPLSNYVAQLPAAYLLKGDKKWLLKALLQRYGGKPYTQRRKEGFGMPFGSWIRQGQTDFLWQWLQQKEHPLHEVLPVSITQELLQLHRSGRTDYSQELMALTLLAIWMEKHF